MKKHVLAILGSVTLLFACSTVNAFDMHDLQDMLDQLNSCPIQSDADIDAKAKRLAGEQCASQSCSSYGYRYDYCDKFSLVTCYQCD